MTEFDSSAQETNYSAGPVLDDSASSAPGGRRRGPSPLLLIAGLLALLVAISGFVAPLASALLNPGLWRWVVVVAAVAIGGSLVSGALRRH
jgi:hypothetical protein